MYCSNCGKEASGNFCQHCGAALNNQNSSPTNNPSVTQPPTKKQKMKKGCLYAIIIYISIGLIVAISTALTAPNTKTDATKQAQPLENVIFNAAEYSNISTEELVAKLGEPESVDSWNNKTFKGTFAIDSYCYETDDAYIEFLTHDNTVVKVYYTPNTPFPLPETDRTNLDRSIIRMFGIEPGSEIARTANTGWALRYTSVADNVDNFDVYDIDQTNKTAGFVYITYDNSYFND